MTTSQTVSSALRVLTSAGPDAGRVLTLSAGRNRVARGPQNDAVRVEPQAAPLAERREPVGRYDIDQQRDGTSDNVVRDQYVSPPNHPPKE